MGLLLVEEILLSQCHSREIRLRLAVPPVTAPQVAELRFWTVEPRARSTIRRPLYLIPPLHVPIYQCTLVLVELLVERVQTGVRMEKRLLKVLKAFAEYHDLTLGDLLEGIVLHAFEGKCPFNPESQAQIKELKKFYGLELDAGASHKLKERGRARRSR
jgi:hypothetical protein